MRIQCGADDLVLNRTLKGIRKRRACIGTRRKGIEDVAHHAATKAVQLENRVKIEYIVESPGTLWSELGIYKTISWAY